MQKHKKFFLATNNEGKIERFKFLIKNISSEIELYTMKDLGVDLVNVKEDGKTLLENAEIKARAYLGKVDMPILANDTGFYVEGEGFIEAPKRIALGGKKESELTKKEIAELMLNFWIDIATKHGGKVDATWHEDFVVLYPDGEINRAQSRREVILTNQVFGESPAEMPIRSLYISKVSNKPAVLETEEERIVEMRPVTEALTKVLLV